MKVRTSILVLLSGYLKHCIKKWVFSQYLLAGDLLSQLRSCILRPTAALWSSQGLRPKAQSGDRWAMLGNGGASQAFVERLNECRNRGCTLIWLIFHFLEMTKVIYFRKEIRIQSINSFFFWLNFKLIQKLKDWYNKFPYTHWPGLPVVYACLPLFITAFAPDSLLLLLWYIHTCVHTHPHTQGLTLIQDSCLILSCLSKSFIAIIFPCPESNPGLHIAF